MHTITFEKGLATFLDGLHGKNRSSATIRAGLVYSFIGHRIGYSHSEEVSICIHKRFQ